MLDRSLIFEAAKLTAEDSIGVIRPILSFFSLKTARTIRNAIRIQSIGLFVFRLIQILSLLGSIFLVMSPAIIAIGCAVLIRNGWVLLLCSIAGLFYLNLALDFLLNLDTIKFKRQMADRRRMIDEAIKKQQEEREANLKIQKTRLKNKIWLNRGNKTVTELLEELKVELEKEAKNQSALYLDLPEYLKQPQTKEAVASIAEHITAQRKEYPKTITFPFPELPVAELPTQGIPNSWVEEAKKSEAAFKEERKRLQKELDNQRARSEQYTRSYFTNEPEQAKSDLTKKLEAIEERLYDEAMEREKKATTSISEAITQMRMKQGA